MTHGMVMQCSLSELNWSMNTNSEIILINHDQKQLNAAISRKVVIVNSGTEWNSRYSYNEC